MSTNSPDPAVKEEPPNASAWDAAGAGWKPGIKFSVELPIFSGAFPEMPDTDLGDKLLPWEKGGFLPRFLGHYFSV